MASERFAVIASKGTLDMALPPLILASTAASVGVETAVFFTFYGLNIVHKEKMKRLKMTSLGNPAVPIVFPTFLKKVPLMGRFLSVVEKTLPGLPQVLGVFPGMTDLMTSLMDRMRREKGVASVPELLEICKEVGVKLVPCQMTMELFGYRQQDLIEGLESPAGAATFIQYVLEAEKPMVVFV